MKSINIGVLAHVDAGKTTITENMLSEAGAIRKRGTVDEGNTVTDSMEVERERGISVKSAMASLVWNNTKITIVDTPGHIDFISEVQRAVRVLDLAVLVVSAVEGLQANTFLLYQALNELKIPVLFVVNKVDRAGSDYQSLLDGFSKELGVKPFPLHSVVNEGLKEAELNHLFEGKELMCDAHGIKSLGLENLAETDEETLNKYLEGEPLYNEYVYEKLKQYLPERNLCPVLVSVAKNNIGTKELLNFITDFYVNTEQKSDGDVSAYVFKTDFDKSLGKLAFVKILQGQISSRDELKNNRTHEVEKVSQIRVSEGAKLLDKGFAQAGEVVVFGGLKNTRAGDLLGDGTNWREFRNFQEPLISVKVLAEKDAQYSELAQALEVLNSEDPLLNFMWNKKEQEFHLSLMGGIQQEILERILIQRFNIETKFEEPTIIYKETIMKSEYGSARYTMPKPCWAVLTLLIEPAEPGSGISYESKVSVDKIHQKYQNEIAKTVPKALRQGIKGWEVSDVKVTLMEGENHEMHSRPGDFILATPMAVMDALNKAGTQLLEPLYNYYFSVPEEVLGAVVSELNKRRATIGNPESLNGYISMTGKIPVATSLDLSQVINSLSGGTGKLRLVFGGYQPCNDEDGIIKPYKGVNPLDRSQWILHHRGAYKAEDRDF